MKTRLDSLQLIKSSNGISCLYYHLTLGWSVKLNENQQSEGFAILKNSELTDEELMIAFPGPESLINSRPLTCQSADPKVDAPLTFNHFLHRQAAGAFAPESVDEDQFNPKKRWRRVQELVRHFWRRWMQEWLPNRNARKKWFKEQRNVSVGDVVLVISPDYTRGEWPIGKVVET